MAEQCERTNGIELYDIKWFILCEVRLSQLLENTSQGQRSGTMG